jgi:hypothetical protein
VSAPRSKEGPLIIRTAVPAAPPSPRSSATESVMTKRRSSPRPCTARGRAVSRLRTTGVAGGSIVAVAAVAAGRATPAGSFRRTSCATTARASPAAPRDGDIATEWASVGVALLRRTSAPRGCAAVRSTRRAPAGERRRSIVRPLVPGPAVNSGTPAGAIMDGAAGGVVDRATGARAGESTGLAGADGAAAGAGAARLGAAGAAAAAGVAAATGAAAGAGASTGVGAAAGASGACAGEGAGAGAGARAGGEGAGAGAGGERTGRKRSGSR